MRASASFALALPILAAAINLPPRQLGGILPTGILPTGILPTGILPTGILPTGILPTGILPTGILPTGILPIGPSNNCDTGSTLCCASTQTSSPTLLSTLSGALGVVLPEVDGLIGVTCTPIDVVGVSGTSCSQQPVCCSDNSFNGVIALGCNPLNLNV
ncbi:fungal hydrophobin-domain-containing protein [Flammula alnicola]|nr:fungal hydrophobin-domain-containing protein [Flammula alnicola]